jgi:nitroreductase
MKTTEHNPWPLAATILGLGLALLSGAELKPVPLPAPQTDGGKPLMQALKERRTIREFKPDPLPAQTLANLLWAAFGINRPASGHRTAPSAMNSQEVDIYVALPEGLYLYDARTNALTPVLAGDLRALTTGQPAFKQAPVVRIFVADLSRLAKAKPESRRFYADVDTGYISQNVYLYCASAGLATVVHDLDRAPLLTVMKLRPEQQIILAQPVGYPHEGKSETRNPK